MARHTRPVRSQFEICTQDCGARCCRYLTVEVPAPRAKADWDEMRWWLAHEGVMVSKDEDGWLLHVQTRCTNLRTDNACGVYPHHMNTCKSYDAETCEFTGPLDYHVLLQSELDLARHIEKRKLKRAAPIARDIRMAHKRKAAMPKTALVRLQGLPSSTS
jgi:Fe-S-cluster containining protein